MRGKAGSRKRITLNHPQETVRIILLLLLLGSVAAFAASREKTALKIYARSTAPVQSLQTVPISRPAVISRPNSGQSATSPASRSSDTRLKQPVVVAEVEPFTETTSFRLLWVTAGFGLVVLLRCQRRQA